MDAHRYGGGREGGKEGSDSRKGSLYLQALAVGMEEGVLQRYVCQSPSALLPLSLSVLSPSLPPSQPLLPPSLPPSFRYESTLASLEHDMAADPRLPLSHIQHTLGIEGGFPLLLPVLLGMVEKVERRKYR